MALTPDVARARELGLDAALRLHAGIAGEFTLQLGVGKEGTVAAAETAVRSTAETLTAWLLGTQHVSLNRGQVVSQATGQPTGTTNQGAPMQLHDDEKFALSVDTKDAKGFETADSVTWTIDDGTVASLTVTDDAAGLSATEAIDVVAGGTATISFVEGAVEKQ